MKNAHSFPRYSLDKIREMCGLIDTGQSIRSVAKEHAVNYNLLTSWYRGWQASALPKEPTRD